ncbi:transposase [Bifidobacterium sp. 82T24]|uniref:Transposase n=1 Tax=Bifidobacterium saimiriisciurei TaxID=2661627 RepID=A0ABX0CA30_9BIFI|nr:MULTISPECIES: transposase [Bifidobacterium]MBW3088338.1 transposase [Bifidobacterium pluvialisilvae]NEG97033.1 transposase [Bifidobacterium sp. SMB2]NEH11984.1 transposase [Bifidobacterium saimiriisciurei]
MANKEIDSEMKSYLESLPAVESVMSDRIYYSDTFKRYVVQRYAAGDSPTRIFREAGLGPSIIRKRIERCIARWHDRAAELGVDISANAEPVAKPSDFAAISPVEADLSAENTDDGRHLAEIEMLMRQQVLLLEKIRRSLRSVEHRLNTLEAHGCNDARRDIGAAVGTDVSNPVV